MARRYNKKICHNEETSTPRPNSPHRTYMNMSRSLAAVQFFASSNISSRTDMNFGSSMRHADSSTPATSRDQQSVCHHCSTDAAMTHNAPVPVFKATATFNSANGELFNGRSCCHFIDNVAKVTLVSRMLARDRVVSASIPAQRRMSNVCGSAWSN